SIVNVVEIVATIGAISGIAYNLLCFWSGFDFLRGSKLAGEGARPTPPVSILKPLKGTDPGMYDSFRTHCLQDYPDYEIIFGVNDRNDPAVAVVERLKAEFPRQQIVLMVCDQLLGANVKVSNLAQMVAEARHQYLVVSDSDIRVGPQYLSRVIAPLHDAKVGLVTCLYRGIAGPNLGSRLESIGISTDFAPGVLAARIVERGIHFGLGSTLALRRTELAAIGGFESFADYLADDYELGRRISELGLQVVLSNEVVDTFLPLYSLAEFIRHQLRWSRTVRGSRYWGFASLIFTFALPWAFLAVLFSEGEPWAWVLVLLALCLRLAVAVVVGDRVLQDKHCLRWAWLIPLRDVLAVFIWAASLAGDRIAWRGDRFRLKDGKLVRLSRDGK
ncbi:MAG: bacteriohopanetetrol glucosamine biosynthesis glycosyltransferase HpnI, partial [Terriglobales bacterium]